MHSVPDRGLHGLAGAYVLDALPADEERAFRSHLETCEVCRLEVEELGETVARLGLAAASTPPAGMRVEVLSRAASERQRTPRSPARGRHDAGFRRVLAPVAAALAASAVTLAVVDLREPPPVDPAVSQVLAAGDVRTEAIEASSGRASVHHSSSDGRAVLAVDGLAAPGPDEVYQVWSYRNGAPQPVGYLMPDEGGSARVALPPHTDAPSVAVTVEPRGGSDVPTGRVVAQGQRSGG